MAEAQALGAARGVWASSGRGWRVKSARTDTEDENGAAGMGARSGGIRGALLRALCCLNSSAR